MLFLAKIVHINMNFINNNIFVTLLLSGIACFLGSGLSKKQANIKKIIPSFGIPALACGFYYLHLWELSIVYIEWRAIPYIEVLCGLIGLPIGYFGNKSWIIRLLCTMGIALIVIKSIDK